MFVVQVNRFGPPEVLTPTQAPDPVAGEGQAVIDVTVADILFIETQVRNGWGREFFSVEPPYVPGDGVAGHVRAVGPGVDPGWVGRRVAAHAGGYGGYAEQVVVPVEALIPVPDGLELPRAAALLNDGTTALTVFEAAEVTKDDQVLITAAAGGLGSLLVQLSHAAGARTIAAARGERKLATAHERGADVLADYSYPDWTTRVREATGGRGVDVVFDGVGGAVGRAAFELTAPGARFSAHGAPSGSFTAVDPRAAQDRGVRLRGIQDVQRSAEDRRRLATRAVEAAARGELRPLIGRTFPLAQAAAAHRALEAREVIGKALLLLP
ncbi:zinc-binding dehydrogenase [Streptomyces neyagawaensis]|uniref:zinc-binding dehydrogenase n=2 Tax=Streptomyces neyagawaensis TaxID=42238 RepID=UPI00201D2ABD|nr:zinc-binding dehydrogenase [Streptomyces neyagawaensis]MCL6731487.1 zinc-binding dehydrogenase [Streptomyces neyagawaensis]MDE1688800.1 zinc-binding dehydrogenase [Streptomyces neyagawaensis]